MRHLISFLFLCIYFTGFGQNYLMDNNQSGFHLSGQIAFSEKSHLFTLSPGYTNKDNFSIYLNMGRESYSARYEGILTIQPSISYLILKESEKQPLTVEFNSFYQYSKSGNFSIGIWGLGGTLHAALYEKGKVKILPGIGTIFNIYAKPPDNYYIDTSSFVSYQFFCSILLDDTYIQPFAQLGNEEWAYGVGIGVVF